MKQNSLTQYIQANRDYLRSRFDSGATYSELAREAGFYCKSFTSICYRLQVTKGVAGNVSAFEKHKEWIVEQLNNGRSYQSVARELGFSREGLRLKARQWGVKSKHNCRCDDPVMVTYEGKKVSLRHAANKAKIGKKTLYKRYQIYGDDPDKLFAPVRHHPETYELGMPLDKLREYAEAAQEIGGMEGYHFIRNKTGVPYGALTAISRGEEWRVG